MHQLPPGKQSLRRTKFPEQGSWESPSVREGRKQDWAEEKDSLDPMECSAGGMALQSGPQSGPENWAFLSSLIWSLDMDITWAKEYYL